MSFFKLAEERIQYTDTTKIDKNYTEKMDREYNWMSKIYDAFIFVFPVWKRWIRSVIPYIQGRRILEVSFGNGYLMSKYGRNRELAISGIDYNRQMIELTRKKMARKKIAAELSQGNVEDLPFAADSFDTIINTMAFSGYPDGNKALAEMKRVLKPGGRLLLVDFDYPDNRNVFGCSLVKLWEKWGDIIKDIETLLKNQQFPFRKKSVGGFDSVYLFICEKTAD